MNCPKHPAAVLQCPACNGAKAGLSRSPKKLRSAKKNLALANRAKLAGKAVQRNDNGAATTSKPSGPDNS